MINLFGGNYNEVGSIDKNLILKTQGKIKIQWNKKFIDLIDNNGNINAKLNKLITSVDSTDKIVSDGFYYLNGNIIASVGGEQIILAAESGTVYVSFLEKQDTTEEQKKIAQKNIGIYYDSVDDVDIENGIIVIDNELYVITDGVVSKYYMEIPNPYPKQFVISKEDENIGAFIIEGEGINNSLVFNTLNIYSEDGYSVYQSDIHKFRSSDKEIIRIDNQGLTTNQIQSYDANENFGFRIINIDGKYVLQIDSLEVRDGIKGDKFILPTIYFKEQNLITAVQDNVISTKYPASYSVGNKLIIYSEEENEDYIDLVPIEVTITEIVSDTEFKVEDNDVSGTTNCICALKNDDLIIGKIPTTYNSKEDGIISKQNILYSAKFDKEGTGSSIYPFYSDALYTELENNIDDDNYTKYIIPPYGLLLRLPIKDINKIKNNPSENNQILIYNNNSWEYTKYLVTPLKEINNAGLSTPTEANSCVTYDGNNWTYVVQTKYSDFESYPFTSVSYVSADKKIYFYNKKSEKVGEVDATDFIKDGMVSNVAIVTEIEQGVEVRYLKITFNTDSGHEDIKIPLTDIFDPNNYYTKQEIDNSITETKDSSDNVISKKITFGSNSIEVKKVALTNSYNDLDYKPTIPDAQVQSDWNETDTNSKAYIKNKPTTLSGYGITDAKIENNGNSVNITLGNKTETFYNKSQVDDLIGQISPGGGGESLPIGSIIMWGLGINNIPSGWHQCDGGVYDGVATPDLRDRFVMAAGPNHAAGTTGGRSSITISNDNMPLHNHKVYQEWGSNGDDASNSSDVLSFDSRIYRTSDDSVIYTGHVNSYVLTEYAGKINPDSIDIIPSYYALIYIMKTRNEEPTGCSKYQFTEMTYQFALWDNVGSAVANTSSSYEALQLDTSQTDSWIHLESVQESGGLKLYIVKPDDTNRARTGTAVFTSSDDCVFSMTIAQG